MRSEEEIREEILKSQALKAEMNSLDLKAVLDIRIRQLEWVLNDKADVRDMMARVQPKPKGFIGPGLMDDKDGG